MSTEGSAQDPPRGEPRVDVHLESGPLDLRAAYDAVADPECGGVGLFCGVVRNHHRGDAVEGLRYEAWEEQAVPKMREVADAVLDAHPAVRAVHLSHRTGRLAVGEISVIVAASAPHRHQALAATRELIDRLKQTVPIWKREELADGDGRWPGDDAALA